MRTPFNSLLAIPMTLALAIGLAGHATPASAQAVGLIAVNLSEVDVEIAEDLNVNVSQIPVTVQVPVGIAANVCGLQVITILSGQITECEAENTSVALNRFVQKQIVEQEQ